MGILNAIRKYFKYRQSLIDQYVKGDMTKSEYLSRNLDAVLGLNIKPFTRIDTVEKGLFNYQYHNAMAKESVSFAGRMNTEAHLHYKEKDKAALSVVRLLEYENVAAYFIKVRSKHLKGKIFEIVLQEYNTIMHSKSSTLLDNLKRAGVFREGTHTSLIDGYINQTY